MQEDKPGSYDAVSCAYCVIIKSLPIGSYRVMFGGKGRGAYYTNSVYDLYVEDAFKESVVDISSQPIKI